MLSSQGVVIAYRISFLSPFFLRFLLINDILHYLIKKYIIYSNICGTQVIFNTRLSNIMILYDPFSKFSNLFSKCSKPLQKPVKWSQLHTHMNIFVLVDSVLHLYKVDTWYSEKLVKKKKGFFFLTHQAHKETRMRVKMMKAMVQQCCLSSHM